MASMGNATVGVPIPKAASPKQIAAQIIIALWNVMVVVLLQALRLPGFLSRGW